MKVLGLVGATGIVGQTIIDLFEQKDHSFTEIKLFASSQSSGKYVSILGKKVLVQTPNVETLSMCNAIIFACESKISEEFIPLLAPKGILCIDKSAAFRHDKRSILCIPEINGQKLKSETFKDFPVVSSPNCCAIPLVMTLKALKQSFGIERAAVSTYQSVSGAGKQGIDTLSKECQDFFQSQDLSCQENTFFPKSIAFNIIPWISDIDNHGMSGEEEKIISETRVLLEQPNLPLGVTCVRVPTFVGHGLAVTVQLKTHADIQEIQESLRKFPGISVSEIATPREAQGLDDVFVSRIRKTDLFDHGVSFWIICDNLRKGAATNTWQILEEFAKTPS